MIRKILFVDAGNYSRSPAAEVISKTQSKKDLPGDYVFSSAGLKDKHVGGPADPRTIEECAKRGYDLSAFVCRQIAVGDFDVFDLILAMDRANLEALDAIRPAGAHARIDLFIPAGEVPDPYFGGADGFVTAIGLIEQRVGALIKELAAP